MLYRTYVFGHFSREDVPVRFYTTWLRENTFFEMPRHHDEIEAMKSDRRHFGKISGMKIIDRMLAGELDAGTVGESSYLYHVSRGTPDDAPGLRAR